MKGIRVCIFGGYLGFALSVFADTQFYTWQFYAILIPTVFLSAWVHN